MCLDLSICAYLSIYLSVGLTFSESQKQVTNLEDAPSAHVPLAPMTLSDRVVKLTRSRSNSERFVREQQATRVFCLWVFVGFPTACLSLFFFFSFLPCDGTVLLLAT